MGFHLWCLHGNLQLPTVWAALSTELRTHFGNHCQITSENLWTTLAPNCQSWAEQFCQRVESLAGKQQQVLLGYSLGGRLALQAVLHQPKLWTGAIIVAADPGLTRQPPGPSAQRWADRFLTEPWEPLLQEWDALPVFQGKTNLTQRPETSFSRQAIHQAFNAYAKSKQADLQPALNQLDHPPILYITGAEDNKYTQIGQTLAASCLPLQHHIIPDAGHRVPWENPPAFTQTVITFLHRIHPGC